MKASIGNIKISVSDAYIKKFKTKDAFIKAQLKTLKYLNIEEYQLKEVLGDMYSCLK